MNGKKIVVAGVGGQGVLILSKIIAHAAYSLGLDVKMTQTLGMAQRGGCVSSHIKYGGKIFSSKIAYGEADLLLGLEPLEALRSLPYLREDGTCFCELNPLWTPGYPPLDEVIGSGEKQGVQFYDLLSLAVQAGDSRYKNTVLCGIGQVSLDLPEEALIESIRAATPRHAEGNIKAFHLGRNLDV